MKYHYIRKSKEDQFYTKPSLAKDLLDFVLNKYGKKNVYLEPSAGNGSFIKPMIKRNIKFQAYDIDPRHYKIKKLNFLNFELENFNFITIGNPPFGKNSSMAIKFFNKCSEISQVICFIVPKTFKKISVHNRLNLNFHLKHNIDLEKKSFLFKNQPFDVPSCFQIWEKENYKRKIIKPNNIYLDFVIPKLSDFCIRRVGGRAGQILVGKNHSLSSTYFVKEKIRGLKKIIKEIDFSDFINNTAGVRSLSKTELILAIRQKISNE